MDEMKIKSSFMKALLSTILTNFLRSKGIEIDISIADFEMTRDDNTKQLKMSVRAEGSCTDEELTKLFN